MQAILDHLTAILVGATLLGALLFVQVRQQQSSIETVVRDRSQTHTRSFFTTLEREVENMRTRDQSQHALGYYATDIQGTDDLTQQFTFVTKEPADPVAGTTGDILAVSYRLVPTGENVRVGTASRATYDIERWTNELDPVTGTTPDTFTRVGTVATGVVGFRVRAFKSNGARVYRTGSGGGYFGDGAGGGAWRDFWAYPSDDPVRFEIEVEGAQEGPQRLASDQAATSTQGLVTLAHSIRPVNVGAAGSSTVDTGWAPYRYVPLLPGEPSPPGPEMSPPTGGSGGGGSGGGGGSTGGGGTGGNPYAGLPSGGNL